MDYEFSHSLITWLSAFMDRHHLWPKSGRCVLGLSGGADSMLLAYCLNELVKMGRLEKVHYVHVDHGLRDNSARQAFALKNYLYNRLGIDVKIVRISAPIARNNIELWARTHRYKILERKLKACDKLYLAHHIDDSMEWFIRQHFNSSGSVASFGAPVLRGPIARPFHCMSRAHIMRALYRLDLKYIKDESNSDETFERNYIRSNITSVIKEYFPSSCAHFVEKANKWAYDQGLHASTNYSTLNESVLGPDLIILRLENSQDPKDWSAHKQKIIDCICQVSDKARGNLRENLATLLQACDHVGKRGPLRFSGAVEVYIYPFELVITKTSRDETNSWQEDLLSQLNNFSKDTQIPDCNLSKMRKSHPAHGLVLYRSQKWLPAGLKKDPLFQEVIDRASLLELNVRPLTSLWHYGLRHNYLTRPFAGLVLFSNAQ